MPDDCWDAEVTVEVVFAITGTVEELGLSQYSSLDTKNHFGARHLLDAMKKSGGSAYVELKKNWALFTPENMAEVAVFIRSKEFGHNEARDNA